MNNVLKSRGSKEPRITEIRIGLTNACNLACAHCYASSGHKAKDELTANELKSLLERLAVHGTERLSITGGEPLVEYEKLKYISCIAHSNQLHVRLNTNGVLLSAKIISELKEVGVKKFQISLNGVNAAANDAMCGVPGAFERTVIAAREVARQGIDLDIRFTITQRNLHDIESCYELAKQVGAGALKLRLMLPAGRMQDGANLANSKEVRDVVASLVSKRHHEKPRIILAQPCFAFLDERLSGVESTKCLCGENYAYVSCQGDISPCLFLVHLPEWCVGNIRKDDIVEVWHKSPVLLALRSRYPSKCKYCIYWKKYKCRNGCFAMNVLTNRQLKTSVPACMAQH